MLDRIHYLCGGDVVATGCTKCEATDPVVLVIVECPECHLYLAVFEYETSLTCLECEHEFTRKDDFQGDDTPPLQ